jgi:GT2 family glycosyltransferase
MSAHDLASPIRELDMLAAAFRPDEGIERSAGGFAVRRAWAMARFGDAELETGWWKLECESSGDMSGVEVRLSSPQDPLIIFEGERAQAIRIFLRGGRTYNISLLVSAWPGDFRFETLKLSRLSLSETASLIQNGLRRLLRRKNPLGMLAHVSMRMLEGQSLWVRTAGPSAAADSSGSPPAPFSTTLPTRVETRGGIAAVLGADDMLHPRAFDTVAQEFARLPALQAIYADVAEGAAIVPRPEWDAELARWFDIAGAPVFFRKGGGDVADAGERLRDILARSGPQAIGRIPLALTARPVAYRPDLPPVPAPVLARTPSVSVVIPTKLRIDLLEKCLDGLIANTGYPDLQVVVVNNGAADPRYPALIARAAQSLNLVEIRDDGDFNFPRLINAGVKRSSGEIVLLLNDDVEPIAAGWLHRMVDAALAPDVGAVGARLVYPEGPIQHAGVILGLGGVCGHLWKGLSADEAARNPHVVYPGARLAVTGACLAVRREAFDQVGGLDEQAFPVAYNDIDFCLRLHAAGCRNIYRGDVVLVHYESQSRGHDNETSRRRLRLARETGLFLKRWRRMIEDDPFGSPEFDPAIESGAVHRLALAGVRNAD